VLDERLGLVILCSRRFREDAIPVPKYMGVWYLIKIVFYRVHLSYDILTEELIWKLIVIWKRFGADNLWF